REVPSGWHHGPAFEVVIALRPLARHQHHFLEEDCGSCRCFDHWVTLVRRLPMIVRRLVVVAGRRAVTLAHPVDRESRAEVVLAEAAFDLAVAIAPGAAFLENPCRQPDRRVIQGVGDGLWLGALKAHVAGFVIEEIAVPLEPSFFTGAEVLWRRTATREKSERDQQMDMDSDQAISVLVAELSGHDRPPISPFCGKFAVAEYILHQLHPQIRGGPVIDTGGGQRSREAVAGQ